MNAVFRRILCCTGSVNQEIAPQRQRSNLISYGAHGKVYKELLDGKLYACKVFTERLVYEKELRIIKKIQNSKYLQNFKKTNSENMSIYCDFIPGKDLFYYIQQRSMELKNPQPTFANKKIKKIGKHIISGLIELQAFGFAHLDIKLENVIVDDYLNATLIDFDTSHYLFTNSSLNVLNRFVGTTSYAAPEIYEKHYNNKSDVWSLGVVLWILKTGNYPYIINDEHTNVDVSVKGIESFNRYELINDSEVFCDLMMSIFQENPSERISLEDLKNHEFFN